MTVLIKLRRFINEGLRLAAVIIEITLVKVVVACSNHRKTSLIPTHLKGKDLAGTNHNR